MKQWLKNAVRPFLGHSWILMYHRIDVAPVDPWDLAVRPEVFEAQLAWLKKHRTVLTLPELMQRWKEGKLDRHSVAISFDDGYLDNRTTALPLLEKYELPASFFLCTDAITSGEGYWWDALQELVFAASLPGGFVFSLNGKTFPAPNTPATPSRLVDWRYPQPPPDNWSRLYLDLWSELRMLPHEEQRSLLRRWAEEAGLPLRPVPVIDRQQARELAAHPLIAIGAHTMTHAALQYLDVQRQEAEMLGSKKLLEDWTGSAVTMIAYPYGSYSADTFALAGQLGFTSGFTTQSVAINRAANAWSVGRYMVTNASRLSRL